MSEDLSDMINNVKKMVDSGNIPDNIKEVLNNFNDTNSSVPNQNQKNNSISSEKDSDFSSSNINSLNIDVETLLKMKSIIDSINKKDDPRANLLYSLKPYLRESRRNKLDQYVNLLNMTKIADAMRNEDKGIDKNGFK